MWLLSPLEGGREATLTRILELALLVEEIDAHVVDLTCLVVIDNRTGYCCRVKRLNGKLDSHVFPQLSRLQTGSILA